MTQEPGSDPWEQGDPYERYVGRWSWIPQRAL